MNPIVQLTPPAANWLRLQGQLQRALRPPGLEQVERMAHVAAQLGSSQLVMSEAAASLSRSIEKGVAAGMARQQEQLRAAFRPPGPLAASRLTTQLREAPLRPDPALASAFAKAAAQATARLSALDMARVRNALVHWPLFNERAQRDRLALAGIQQELSVWLIDGNRRLQALALTLKRAAERNVLIPVAKALRRSGFVIAPRPSRPSTRPRRSDRVSESLRQLKCLISPNAPPVCPASAGP